MPNDNPVLSGADISNLSASIIDELQRRFQSQVDFSRTQSPNDTYRMTLDLSVAQDEREPYAFKNAFKGVFVEAVTDSSVLVYVKGHGQQAHQGFIKLQQGSQRDFSEGVSGAFLHWPQQAGKTITLVFYTRGTYTSGQIISVNSGGVSINEGSAATSLAPVSVGQTATLVLTTDTARKKATLQNQSSQSVYYGDANVTAPGGAFPGIELPPNGIMDWKNTAALYMVTPLGTVTIATLKEA